MTMKRVVVESPYAGDVEANIAYARRALRDSLARGEAPLAPHLIFPQLGLLDNAVPAERELGIKAGDAWMSRAEMVAFYVDFGWSKGMSEALARARALEIPIEERKIGA